MNRIEFIEKLIKGLNENEVNDIDEIVAEYEEHFAYKLADGYSEEEIAAKLGNPAALALQFASENEEKKSGASKPFVIVGLVFTDIFTGLFFLLLFAWTGVMAAFAVASASTGVCMIAGFNPYSLIPPMPYWCGAVLAASLLALSVLTAVGCLYYTAFARQLVRAYGRYRRNLLAIASGKAALPSVASYPKLSAKTNRRLRKIAMISLAVFTVCFVSGMVVCSISAGAMGFWHEWNWFVK